MCGDGLFVFFSLGIPGHHIEVQPKGALKDRDVKDPENYFDTEAG